MGWLLTGAADGVYSIDHIRDEYRLRRRSTAGDSSIDCAAIFLVATVRPAEDSRAAVRSFCSDLSALVRAVGFRDIEGKSLLRHGDWLGRVGSALWPAAAGAAAPFSRDQGRPAPCGRHARRSPLPHSRQAHGSLLRAGDADHGPARRRGLAGRRGAWLSLFRRPRSLRLRRRHGESDGPGGDRCRLYRRTKTPRSPAAAT